MKRKAISKRNDKTEEKVIFRKAKPDDGAAMAHLDGLCFSDPWSRASFDRELDDNGLAYYLLAEFDGEIIGYAGLWLIVDEGHITNIAVHPGYRCKGIGGRLLSRLMELAEDGGFRRFTLEVREGNDNAIRLYERYGFHIAGCRKGYYENNGENALIMWRASL
ncbi:MAG: ribosomal protein S18-alanine N-acetyltransferase [Anaerovoracaceae bacterium]|jgi:ribosomal-protein-alanine N-acetyltransferase